MHLRRHHQHTPSTRDAALRRLHVLNRAIAAGSIALTGVLAEVASASFKGASSSSSVKREHGITGHKKPAHKHSAPAPLSPPSEAPQAAQEAEAQAPAEEASEAPAVQSEAPAEPPAEAESAPAGEPEPEPEVQAPPAEEAPVTSGGS